MESWRLKLSEASVEFKSAAEKSRKNYRKQHVLQVVTLRDIRVHEVVSGDYSMKHLFQ